MASSMKDINVYDIKKFDGLNFALWKEQIQDILVQKKQKAPILFANRATALTKHFQVTQYVWDELDAMARYTILLYLDCTIAHATWQKLCNTYEKNTLVTKCSLCKSSLIYG